MISESYTIKGGLRVVELFFDLPLDYQNPNRSRLRIHARNIFPVDKAKKDSPNECELPYLLYLQGGPGFEVNIESLREAYDVIHNKGYQTLWLDQRGTGLSSPISGELFEGKPDAEIAEYLKYFRADNIVRDCEEIRKELIGGKEQEDDRKWSILGQSFGGFCSITYLSFFGNSLKEAFLTGGLAPLVDQPDVVYRATINKIRERNVLYYKKYPQDIRTIRTILEYLDSTQPTLPNGGTLSPSRWLSLGQEFGMRGGIDRIHQLVVRAYNDLEIYKKLSYWVLERVQEMQPFDGNPIYAILHEPIYCQGKAARWSAARIVEENPQFTWDFMKQPSHSDEPVYFTGEMIFPSMFNDYANLRSLKGAAELLAADEDWPNLYDRDQLAKNEIKVSAAAYYDDMYVDFNLGLQTAGAIANTELFITNQYLHNGLREDPKTILGTLFDLSKREIA